MIKYIEEKNPSSLRQTQPHLPKSVQKLGPSTKVIRRAKHSSGALVVVIKTILIVSPPLTSKSWLLKVGLPVNQPNVRTDDMERSPTSLSL